MSKASDESRGAEGEDYHELGEVGREVQDMSVMLTITDGEEGCIARWLFDST